LLGKKGAALSISFMSLIILRLQSTECAPMADLISFQEPHSSRGEICQGSRFEKLFRHDLSCCVWLPHLKRATAKAEIYAMLVLLAKLNRSIYHSPPVFCLLSAQGGNRTPRTSPFAFCSATQGK
jgi:hypothetical protein